ncbi:hypothetical protein [Devosia crocina]|uniref:hypothetical protein n=1 Tax=Devosia crocina TaxID=429728 RepID=UPI001113E5FC|nr:hypothetical protein [Devosia crocina]
MFSSLKISSDGARLLWDDGSSLSANAIAKLPHTEMDASEFRSIMADLNMTSEAVGSLLGLSRRAITSYRGGEPIPRVVAIAMQFLRDRFAL